MLKFITWHSKLPKMVKGRERGTFFSLLFFPSLSIFLLSGSPYINYYIFCAVGIAHFRQLLSLNHSKFFTNWSPIINLAAFGFAFIHPSLPGFPWCYRRRQFYLPSYFNFLNLRDAGARWLCSISDVWWKAVSFQLKCYSWWA